MKSLTDTQLVVLVERHLAHESSLTVSLAAVNEASAKVFEDGGLRGPSTSDLERLQPMMDELQKSASRVAESRQTTLSHINRTLQTNFTQLKQYIRTLPRDERTRLDRARRQTLAQSESAQASLIHNQAVLFYTFDYHRKYLAGVLQCDVQPQNYGADGQSKNVSPGDLHPKELLAMTGFDIGLSALRTNQYALEVVSNNIANANTEGYHRRRVHMESIEPAQGAEYRVGRGVTINDIERIRDQVTEAALSSAISDASHVDQRLIIERQIETAFNSGSTSIGEEVNQFFAELSKLTASPDESAQRAAVLESGQRAAGLIRQGSNSLEELRSIVRFQIGQEVEALNEDLDILSKLSVEDLGLAESRLRRQHRA